jgi:hypothetical protein
MAGLLVMDIHNPSSILARVESGLFQTENLMPALTELIRIKVYIFGSCASAVPREIMVSAMVFTIGGHEKRKQKDDAVKTG